MKPQDIKEKIIKAFERSANIDAKGITVEANINNVKLTGKVRSLIEKNEVQKIAYYTIPTGVIVLRQEKEIQDGALIIF